MAPDRHTWTSVHDPWHLLVLLPLRGTQIHEGPETVSTEERPHLVQCDPSGPQRSLGLGGPRGRLEETLQLQVPARGLQRQPSGLKGESGDPVKLFVALSLTFTTLTFRWPVPCGCTTCAR